MSVYLLLFDIKLQRLLFYFIIFDLSANLPYSKNSITFGDMARLKPDIMKTFWF